MSEETRIYGRGDYGTEYAGDLVELIQQWNCAKGCTEPRPEDVLEFGGPGGNCQHLISIFAEMPVPEFEPLADRIVCHARIDPETADMDPLFDIPEPAATKGETA